MRPARRDHVLRTIEPALERGLWVISDRFVDSMIVYQGYGQGADLAITGTSQRAVARGLRARSHGGAGCPGGGGAQAGRRARGIEPLRAHGHRLSRASSRGLHRPRPGPSRAERFAVVDATAGSRNGRNARSWRLWRRVSRPRSMDEGADSAFAWLAPRENPHLVGHHDAAASTLMEAWDSGQTRPRLADRGSPRHRQGDIGLQVRAFRARRWGRGRRRRRLGDATGTSHFPKNRSRRSQRPRGRRTGPRRPGGGSAPRSWWTMCGPPMPSSRSRRARAAGGW